jgi:oxygen-independent coproporphyrinogen III oxidase
VTRISLGVQSLDDAELRFLGRRHSADKAVRAVAAIREAGCRDLSVDLMYGLPCSTVESVERSLRGIVELEPNHVSCYALTLEPETPMGAQAERGELALLGDDSVADQYAAIQAGLAAAGYEQYELSNWARPGHASIHNLTYWRNGEYVGLGAGASGSFMGLRYKRTPVVRDYIAAAAAGEPGYIYEEAWTREMQKHDTVMLGLRLAEGVSDRAFQHQFGVSLLDYCATPLADLVRAGVLVWRGDRLALAPESYFICNAVLAEILPSGDAVEVR